MQYKTKLFMMLSAVLVLCTTNVSAEVTATPPSCKTEIECTKLADDLQVQISELEKSDEQDYDKLDELQKELLSAMRVKTAAQRKKTDAQDKEIAAEKEKQRQEKEKQRQEKEKQAKYDKIIGILKSTETNLK